MYTFEQQGCEYACILYKYMTRSYSFPDYLDKCIAECFMDSKKKKNFYIVLLLVPFRWQDRLLEVSVIPGIITIIFRNHFSALRIPQCIIAHNNTHSAVIHAHRAHLNSARA